jgi:hypothetical protein
MIGGFKSISNYRAMNETIFASRNNIAELQEMLYTTLSEIIQIQYALTNKITQNM